MKDRARTSRSLAVSLIGVTALVLTAAGCAGKHDKSASAATESVSLTSQQACDQGATTNGGTLTYWTSTDAEVFQKEIAPFNAKYPNIKIKYTSLRPADMVQRIVAEVQANHPLDVDAIAGDLPSFAPLFDQKLIQPIDWTKLGIAKDLQFDLQGYTTIRTYRTLLGVGYNTTLVQPSDLPSTWQDLVNSKWSGQIIADPRGVYLSGLSLSMGQDKALEWFKNFLKTDKPLIIKGATASMQKLVSGETKLSTSAHDSEAAEQQSKGAPVGIKYLDIVPTQDWYALVLKGAKNPAAASCFYSWWTGPEGSAQQMKYEFKSNETRPAGLPADSKLFAIENPDQAKLATDVATAFAKLMG